MGEQFGRRQGVGPWLERVAMLRTSQEIGRESVVKRDMFLTLVAVLCMLGVVSAEIATIPVIRDVTGATATVARMRYTGASIDYDYPGSWMMIGDHLHGANHYSDGITKFKVAGLIPSDTINSVAIKGYFHENGDWDGTGNTYIALSKYDFDNSAIPITLADTIDGVGGLGEAGVSYVTTLTLSGEQNYDFADAALTAAVAADIGAGYSYTGFVWRASAPDGTVLNNGSEPHVDWPEVSAIYMTGFPSWTSIELEIDFTPAYTPPTSNLPGIEVTVTPETNYVGTYLEITNPATPGIEFPNPADPYATPYMRLGDRYAGFAQDGGIVKFKLPTEITGADTILEARIEAAGTAYYDGPAGTVYVKIQSYLSDNSWSLNHPDDHPDNSSLIRIGVEQHVEDSAFSWDVAAGVARDIAAGKEYSSYFVRLVQDANDTPLQSDPEFKYMLVYSEPQLRIVYATPPATCAEVVAADLALGADLTQDCGVNLPDYALLAEKWGVCTMPDGAGCVMGDILEPTWTIARGSAVVDAVLDEWDGAEWIPIDKNIYLNPSDVSGAKMALRWSETTDKVYAAVILTDTTHSFTNTYDISWDAGDRVEVFSQGNNAGGTYDTATSESAQQYFFGSTTAADGSFWVSWANGFPLVDDPNFEGAVAVDGDDIIYEFGVRMFDEYCGRLGGCTNTMVSDLQVGKLVRFDVVVDTRWGLGAEDFGVLAATTLENRSGDADSITEFELVEDIPCGAWGYVAADLVRDCVVDLNDLRYFAENWLLCNDPEGVDCIETW